MSIYAITVPNSVVISSAAISDVKVALALLDEDVEGLVYLLVSPVHVDAETVGVWPGRKQSQCIGDVVALYGATFRAPTSARSLYDLLRWWLPGEPSQSKRGRFRVSLSATLGGASST